MNIYSLLLGAIALVLLVGLLSRFVPFLSQCMVAITDSLRDRPKLIVVTLAILIGGLTFVGIAAFTGSTVISIFRHSPNKDTNIRNGVEANASVFDGNVDTNISSAFAEFLRAGAAKATNEMQYVNVLTATNTASVNDLKAAVHTFMKKWDGVTPESLRATSAPLINFHVEGSDHNIIFMAAVNGSTQVITVPPESTPGTSNTSTNTSVRNGQ